MTRGVRVVVVLAVSIAATLPVGFASADTPPYADATTVKTTQPDSIPGAGEAGASATADRTTGVLTASASVAERFPSGTGTSIGRSQAAAQAVIIHTPPVTAGRWEITAILEIPRATAEATTGSPLSRARASTDATLGATSRSCPGGPGSCAPTYAPGTQAFVGRGLACAPGACSVSSPLSLTVTVDAPAPGDIYVKVSLAASADAEGQGSASAAGEASVTSISAVLAGGVGSPPPPPPPPAFAPGVFWDYVLIRGQGAVSSHRALPADRAFLLEVRGLYEYSAWLRDVADAECAQVARNPLTAPEWTGNPDPSDPDALDLLVDDSGVRWTPELGSGRPEAPECSSTHAYRIVMPGTGSLVSFRVRDAQPLDNTGRFVVTIYQLLF